MDARFKIEECGKGDRLEREITSSSRKAYDAVVKNQWLRASSGGGKAPAI